MSAILSETKPSGDRLFPFNAWSKSKVYIDNVSGTTGWTLHDLRRTFATNLAKLGTPPHVIEALLNHKSGEIRGVAAIYNRHRYLDEMRKALEQYEVHLAQLIASRSDAIQVDT